jgi:hypothetical protein
MARAPVAASPRFARIELTLLTIGGFMRHRVAAIVLTLAGCGFVAPAWAADPAPDLSKYLPEGAGFYVHVNVQQFLAAPVVRKAVPMAAKTYEEQIMAGAQIAMMFAPKNTGAPLPNEDQMKSVLKTVQDPQTIATWFDAAKDAVTDVIVAGKADGDDQVMLVIKCHEGLTSDTVKGLTALLGGNQQLQVTAHEKDKKIIFEAKSPMQPQSFFFGLPDAGVLVGGTSQALIEKAMAGSAGGIKGDLKKLVAERKKSDFVFFALTGGGDDNAPRSAWGRLVLDNDISGDVSGTFASGEKASVHAKDLNEHIGQLAETVKGALGASGKDIAAALEKAKAVTTGSTVTAHFSLPGSAVEKLLTKDKEKDK